MKYDEPNMEVIKLQVDIICDSNGLGTNIDNENEWVTGGQ